MKIPKKLKVGGKIYDVEIGYIFKERRDRLGHSNHNNSEIKIVNKDANGRPLPQQTIEDVFIHEMLHCIDERYNSNAIKESAIVRIANGLYQTLRDNNLLR